MAEHDPILDYFTDVRDTHFSGAGVKETSYYPYLSNLLNFMGKTLKGVKEEPLKPPEGVVVVRINPQDGMRAMDGSGIPEYFYEEFPPKRADDGFAPGADRPPTEVRNQIF